MIPKYPHLAIALSNKGSCLYQLGRYGEAIQYFDKALQHLPKDRYVLDQRQLALNALNSKTK
jgi:Tfp pilus assembly protein PilF